MNAGDPAFRLTVRTQIESEAPSSPVDMRVGERRAHLVVRDCARLRLRRGREPQPRPAGDRRVLFGVVRPCAPLLPRIATGFGHNGPVLATRMADTRSERWRRGWDSNPGSLRSTVFKTAAIDRSATSPRWVHAQIMRELDRQTSPRVGSEVGSGVDERHRWTRIDVLMYDSRFVDIDYHPLSCKMKYIWNF